MTSTFSLLPVAHDVSSSVPRTRDVAAEDGRSFSDLGLADRILRGVARAGFARPSPVQSRALPPALLGLDLVVQSKSGTGKTLVYVVSALAGLDKVRELAEGKEKEGQGEEDGDGGPPPPCLGPRVLVVAPTREIAVQGTRVALEVASEMKEVKVHALIGGMSVQDDVRKLKTCHLAIGTPGRIKQLIEEKHLKTEAIRMFVLDEADKLMEKSFYNDVTWIFNRLPTTKQVMALSATYPPELAALIEKYMRSPHPVRLGVDSQVLEGVAQFAVRVARSPSRHRTQRRKAAAVFSLLNTTAFSQCIVFSNSILRAEALAQEAENKGIPAGVITGTQDQRVRLQGMNQLKNFQVRVLFTTDLVARGVDARNVDLIINEELPWDAETYLHRIGRAGRFGTRGMAVSIVATEKRKEVEEGEGGEEEEEIEEGKELDDIRKIVFKTGSQVKMLPPFEDLPEGFDLCNPGELQMPVVLPLAFEEDKAKDKEGEDEEGSEQSSHTSGKVKKRSKRGGKKKTKKEDEAEGEEMPPDITKAWVPVVRGEENGHEEQVGEMPGEADYYDITRAWVPVKEDPEEVIHRNGDVTNAVSKADFEKSRATVAAAAAKARASSDKYLGKGRQPKSAAEIEKILASGNLSALRREDDHYKEAVEAATAPEVAEALEIYVKGKRERFGKKLEAVGWAMEGMSLREAVEFAEKGEKGLEELVREREEEESGRRVSFERKGPRSGARNKKMQQQQHTVGPAGDSGFAEAREEKLQEPKLDFGGGGGIGQLLKTLTSLSSSTAGVGESSELPVDRSLLPHPDPDEVIPSSPGEALSDLRWMEEWLRRVRENADFIRDYVMWKELNQRMGK